MAKDFSINSLETIRIFDPTHIPEYLIGQIKDRDFSVEAFYAYQKEVCTFMEQDKMVINPYNLLFVIVDADKRVHGFIWGVVDILNGILCINNFSMDKRWWGKGKAIELLKNWALEIKERAKLKKIYWITKKSKYCERHGFEQSKNILFEYVGGQVGTSVDRNPSQTTGRDETDGPGTVAIPDSGIVGDGTESERGVPEPVAAI